MLAIPSVTARLIQAPAIFRSMAAHIPTTPAQQAQVKRLAPKINQVRPGIYSVGSCFVSLWRMSCTCKQARARKHAGTLTARPCIHLVTLAFAGIWTPCDPEPTAYLRRLGVTQPQVIAVYCRATLPACYPAAPRGFRILGTFKNATTGEKMAQLENIATGTHATVPTKTLTHIQPFYE